MYLPNLDELSFRIVFAFPNAKEETEAQQIIKVAIMNLKQ
jgi:hypothetical protein